MVEVSCASADWPNRRTAPKTIHAAGDSTGPTGPPVGPTVLANALKTADTTAAGRTAAGAGSTTALGRAALTVALDAFAGWAETDSAGGVLADSAGEVLADSAGDVLTDFGVDSAEAELAVSLIDAAATGLTFFTGPVDDECPEPDGFFSDLVVDTSSLATPLATSVLVS